MVEKMNEETRNTFLDSYGFAQLASQSPRLSIEAMRTMYGTLLDKEDSFISNAVDMAGIARNQNQTKAKYDAAKVKYDAAPKDTRGEFKLKDPGQPDQNLTQSLYALMDATKLYTDKRQSMISEMNPAEMLAYNSTSDGKSIVAMPNNIKNLLQKSKTPIKDIKDKGIQKTLYAAISAADNYKIHGVLNAQVERDVAIGELERLSENLVDKKAA